LQALFAQLKQLSRELLSLLRLSSLLPRSSGLSPILARRLELFIAKKDVHEAGLLADFMSNVVEASLEDKLGILASLDVKARLERAIELLKRQVEDIKGNMKITSVTNTTSNLDRDQMNELNKQRMRRNMLGAPYGIGSVRSGMPSMPSGSMDDSQELSEIDELKQKLDDANLSPEAAKVADREMKRLAKMNPQQAEYNVG
jgi:ATP-dependent Lon protease